MKRKYLYLFVFLPFLFACHFSVKKTNPALLCHLSKMHAKLDLFSLKKLYESKEDDLSLDYKLYYGACINSYFNFPDKSNRMINRLIRKSTTSVSDSMMAVLYTIKETNHARLFEYREASETCKKLLDCYSMFFDSIENEEILNAYYFWKALENVPKQKLQVYGRPEMPLRTDSRGFWNIEVELADTSCYFIFDTGAGTSMIKRSVAEDQGYHIIDLDYPVKSFTGKKVETNLAIAESIKIGDLTYDNVIFLVIDDEKLEIPNKNIPIGGILGFPVISALKELSIYDGKIEIPQNQLPEREPNMAINNLSLVVQTNYLSDTLLMKFDTGALKSNFQKLFYKQHKKTVDCDCAKKKIRAGGVGGSFCFDVFKSNDVVLSIGESKATLKNLNIFPEELKPSIRYYHGNLGLDFISQFHRIDISFENSTISIK